MTDIITYFLIGLGILLFVLLFIVPFKFVRRLSFNLLISFLVLLLAKLICAPFGVHIGLNPLTLAFTTFLGVPGYTTVLLLSLLL